MQLFIQPYSVFFLSMAFAYYICNCRTQLHRKAEDRPIYLCWSTCTRDFILISSWQSSQTDGRGSAEFIISISLSSSLSLYPTQMHVLSVKTWCIGFHLHKNNIILLCHFSLQSNIDTFSIGSFPDHNQVTRSHSLPLFQSMQCFDMCVQVFSQMGCEFHKSSRTVWGVTQSAECPSQPTHTEFTSNGNSGACWELWVFGWGSLC